MRAEFRSPESKKPMGMENRGSILRQPFLVLINLMYSITSKKQF